MIRLHVTSFDYGRPSSSSKTVMFVLCMLLDPYSVSGVGDKCILELLKGKLNLVRLEIICQNTVWSGFISQAKTFMNLIHVLCTKMLFVR